MATVSPFSPVVLIPARRQTLWGWPAVANFCLGGLGGGVYVVALIASGLGRSPAVVIASWLGPALVLAGFVAVATEAGRPSRGPRVLARVATSWMSRELWIGGAFVALAAADLVRPSLTARVSATVAALLLPLAQGFILRRARGVPAWEVPIVPPLFVLSALVSGAGLYLVTEAAAGRTPAPGVLIGVVPLLLASLLGAQQYVNASSEEDFGRAVLAFGDPRAIGIIAGAGHAVPVGLLVLGLAVPALRPLACVLAGVLIVGAQLHAKVLLILVAGQLRSVTLTGLRLERRLS